MAAGMLDCRSAFTCSWLTPSPMRLLSVTVDWRSRISSTLPAATLTARLSPASDALPDTSRAGGKVSMKRTCALAKEKLPPSFS